MKRGSFVLVASLVLPPAAVAPAANAGPPPQGWAYHTRAAGTSHAQKIRLVRRPHAALPRHHGTRAVRATYSLDDLTSSQNVVVAPPGEQEYARADAVGNTVDVWTDRQGHVQHTISTGRT